MMRAGYRCPCVALLFFAPARCSAGSSGQKRWAKSASICSRARRSTSAQFPRSIRWKTTSAEAQRLDASQFGCWRRCCSRDAEQVLRSAGESGTSRSVQLDDSVPRSVDWRAEIVVVLVKRIAATMPMPRLQSADLVAAAAALAFPCRRRPAGVDARAGDPVVATLIPNPRRSPSKDRTLNRNSRTRRSSPRAARRVQWCRRMADR